MNLFIVYVGGKTATSLIEVHDIHFAIGEKIEDTYDQLRAQWWGAPKSLHLDAWGAVKSVDNFNVMLKPEPAADKTHQLYFINLGGYDSKEFTELHKNIMVVAEDVSAAKEKAKSLVAHWEVPHRDNLYELDDCINVSDLLSQKGMFIHLEPTDNPEHFNFTCKYTPIGK